MMVKRKSWIESLLDRRSFLRLAGAGLIASGMRAAARPPNIVIILCDDLGYGDIGCFGSSIRTPNLDRMAGEGVRFTHFCSASPVCSPSRAALLTGRYPTRVGVPRVLFPTDNTGLPDSETTLAQMLKARHYRTLCVGKWHLGRPPRFLPTNRGFDEYFGIPYSNDMSPRVLLHNTDVVEQEATLDTLTPRYTELAVRFVEQSSAASFFLYMPHTYPHIPLGASPRFRGHSPQGLYGDVVRELDWSVGEVLAALKRTGVDNDTLVLFTSDNGPWFQGSPGRLRGRKGMTWEGGVREPFLARWPGHVPPGKVCTGLASMMDILPTVAALAGAARPDNALDGIDIWPMLSGRKNELDRNVLLYFDDENVQCARLGNWKLHFSRYNNATWSPPPAGGRKNITLAKPELYDLANDPDESYDVAAEHPDVVAKMQGRVAAMIPGFPEEVRRAWTDTLSHQSSETRSGALPVLSK